VVEHICERAFSLHVEPLRDRERLAQIRGKIDQTGAFDRSVRRVAESPDRQRMGPGTAAGQAGIAERPGGIAGAGKGRGVDPVEASLAGGIGADTRNPVCILVAVARIPAGRRGC
jgi:hypothetical protein